MEKESRSKATDRVLREKPINEAIKPNQARKAAKKAKKAKKGRLTWAEFSALYACEEFHSLVELYRQANYDYEKARDEGMPLGTRRTKLAHAEEDTALDLAMLVSFGELPCGGRAW